MADSINEHPCITNVEGYHFIWCTAYAMVPCNASTYLHSVYSIRVLCAFHFQFIVAGSSGQRCVQVYIAADHDGCPVPEEEMSKSCY